MSDSLLLFTKNDIPFPALKTVIHNPTISELGLISEKSYRIGCQLITKAPSLIKNSQGNFNSSDVNDFDIFIEIVNNKESAAVEMREHLMKLFSLLFPNFNIRVRKTDIALLNSETNETSFIDKTNFQDFQKLFIEMFSLKHEMDGGYNPADGMARKIAEKLQKAKQRKNGNVDDFKDISLYKRYASILSIGLQIDLNVILGYTVNQIEDQFQRFVLRTRWDADFDIRLAGGGKDKDSPDDWMKEI